MSHPKFGHKIAYLEAEAVLDEKGGWTRDKPPEVKKEEVSESLTSKRGPGRPKREE
jgi:hypothetical protein